MSKDVTKGDISQRNLELHSIYFQPAEYQPHDNPTQPCTHALPDHIDAVREGLLVMDNIITQEWKRHVCQEFDEFIEANPDSPYTFQRPQTSNFIKEEPHHIDRQKHSLEWHIADGSLERCLGVAKRAIKLLEHPEAEWNFFWRVNVFELFNDEATKQPVFE